MLSTFLVDVYDGNILCKNLINCTTNLTSNEAEHTNKILESYTEWLRGTSKGLILIEILNVISLFDRQITRECFIFLCEDSTFCRNLFGMTRQEIIPLIIKLSDAKLITYTKDNTGSYILDTHPIIRGFFSNRLKSLYMDLWKKGNKRVYKYLTLNNFNQYYSKECIDNLLRSIKYASTFMEVNSVCSDIYVKKVKTPLVSSLISKYGLYSNTLTSLSSFFNNGNWGYVNDNLSLENKLYILAETGYYLTAVMGYSSIDAENCFRQIIDIAVKENILDNSNYLVAVLGICRYYRMTGNLDENKKYADELLKMSEKNSDCLPLAHRALCTYYFYHGELNNCITEADLCADSYYEEKALFTAELDVNEPYRSCLAYKQMCLSLLGHSKDTNKIDLVLENTEKFRHPHTLAIVMLMKVMISQFQSDYEQVVYFSEKMMDICAANGFNQWECAAKILYYWAKIHIDKSDSTFVKLLEYEIELWCFFGAKLFLPYWYRLAADAFDVIDNKKQRTIYLQKAISIEKETTEFWVAKYVDNLSHLT